MLIISNIINFYCRKITLFIRVIQTQQEGGNLQYQLIYCIAPGCPHVCMFLSLTCHSKGVFLGVAKNRA